MPQFVRRCLTLLLMAVVAVASTGIHLIPAPMAELASDSDEWFPCKEHRCGCVTAEMCRTHCCCAKPSAPAEVPQPAKSCCSAKKSATSSRDADAKSTSGSRWIPVIQSAACAGLDGTWVIKTSCWLMTFDRFDARPSARVGLLPPQPAPVPEQLTLSCEPPPPRFC